jgi:predicted aspartyl protease
MARIVKTIEIEGQPAVALFDTGAMYTCVLSPLVRDAPRRAMIPPARVALGGREIEIRELCFVQGKIEGLDFLADAVPVAELGAADGHELDAVIGARTMEQWEIRLDPRTGTLDLEGLRRREFIEF